MDEEVITTSARKFPVELLVMIALAVATYIAYRSFLNDSLRQQQKFLESLPLHPSRVIVRDTVVPVTTMNGKAEVMPVITDEETGAVVESTEGPTIVENTGD